MGEAALAAHTAKNGRNQPWTKDSARVTADALGRAEEAAALRERYGIAGTEGDRMRSVRGVTRQISVHFLPRSSATRLTTGTSGVRPSPNPLSTLNTLNDPPLPSAPNNPSAPLRPACVRANTSGAIVVLDVIVEIRAEGAWGSRVARGP
jgi:hypothetical protein